MSSSSSVTGGSINNTESPAIGPASSSVACPSPSPSPAVVNELETTTTSMASLSINNHSSDNNSPALETGSTPVPDKDKDKENENEKKKEPGYTFAEFMRWRGQLICVYNKHSPERVSKVPGLLRKWKGRESVLIQNVLTKYQTELATCDGCSGRPCVSCNISFRTPK